MQEQVTGLLIMAPVIKYLLGGANGSICEHRKALAQAARSLQC